MRWTLLLLLCSCRSKAEALPVTSEQKPQKPAIEEPEEENGVNAPKDVAKPPANALLHPSGLATRVVRQGTGKVHPAADAKVRVHYTGWTTDGKMFDSSVQRGEPMTLGLNQVIKGWTEGVQLMVEGEKRRMWIPEHLAYGGLAGRPKGMLVFDVELLQIKGAVPAPIDVSAIPSDARVEKSGLGTKVLTPGSGTTHPGPRSTVKVHYTGWTTDGKMFDSSVERGDPAEFPLDKVIPGWTEGLQLMVVGEKRRLWIPEPLAYKGIGAAPKGMLVFDVELLSIPKP
jgi:FKBP-type peptidyl-prolyl cis-trans isomerase